MHKRYRSITFNKPIWSQKDINLKAFIEDEELDQSDQSKQSNHSNHDYCDEYEESLGDSEEYNGRQSVAEMVTMHKLNTTKTICRNHNVSNTKSIKINEI